MKKIVISMLLAALSLSSCIQETTTGATEAEGEKTSMSLRMSFPKNPNTRATGDSNAIEAEAIVNTVEVYIFNDSGAYLSHTSLTAADFTAVTGGTDEDTYQATTPIPTTTGLKNVLVGINLPAKVAKSLEGQTVGRAETNVQTMSIQPSTYDVATSGLPMFSTDIVQGTMGTDDTQNTVTIDVKRLVAKVTVEKSTTMQQDGVAGTLGELTFALNNQNTKFYLLQGLTPDYMDPNWYSSSYDDTHFADATGADYVAVANGHQADVSVYNALYAMENTSDEKTTRELTRVTVQSTFIPTNIVTSYTSGGTVNETTNTATTPTTFYTVTPTNSTQDVVYFSDQTSANTYQADKGGTVSTYTDGVCYWNIFLNKSSATDQWEVLRNDFYQCNITRIVAPGSATAELLNPTTTPMDDTTISVTVNTLYWNTPVMDDYELEP